LGLKSTQVGELGAYHNLYGCSAAAAAGRDFKNFKHLDFKAVVKEYVHLGWQLGRKKLIN